MAKKHEKDKKSLVNHKHLERNIANEIANEIYQDKPKQKK